MKLTKAQRNEHARLLARLQGLHEASDDGLSAFRDAVLGAWAEHVEPWLEPIVTAAAEAEEFREGIASALTGHYEERSERWQESEKGDAHATWAEEWASATVALGVSVDSTLDAIEDVLNGIEAEIGFDEFAQLPISAEDI